MAERRAVRRQPAQYLGWRDERVGIERRDICRAALEALPEIEESKLEEAPSRRGIKAGVERQDERDACPAQVRHGLGDHGAKPAPTLLFGDNIESAVAARARTGA